MEQFAEWKASIPALDVLAVVCAATSKPISTSMLHLPGSVTPCEVTSPHLCKEVTYRQTVSASSRHLIYKPHLARKNINICTIKEPYDMSTGGGTSHFARQASRSDFIDAIMPWWLDVGRLSDKLPAGLGVRSADILPDASNRDGEALLGLLVPPAVLGRVAPSGLAPLPADGLPAAGDRCLASSALSASAACSCVMSTCSCMRASCAACNCTTPVIVSSVAWSSAIWLHCCCISAAK